MPVRQPSPTPAMEATPTAEPQWWGELFAPEAPVPEAPVPAPKRGRVRSPLLAQKKGWKAHPRVRFDQANATQKGASRGRPSIGGGCPICGLPASRCYWWAMNGG